VKINNPAASSGVFQNDFILSNLRRKRRGIQPSKIKFIHNNIRNEDFSDATVIYMSSLCFPTDLMAELSQKFAKLKLGSRIISLVPLHPSKFLQFKKVEILEMSWISASRVYYYERV